MDIRILLSRFRSDFRYVGCIFLGWSSPWNGEGALLPWFSIRDSGLSLMLPSPMLVSQSGYSSFFAQDGSGTVMGVKMWWMLVFHSECSWFGYPKKLRTNNQRENLKSWKSKESKFISHIQLFCSGMRNELRSGGNGGSQLPRRWSGGGPVRL